MQGEEGGRPVVQGEIFVLMGSIHWILLLVLFPSWAELQQEVPSLFYCCLQQEKRNSEKTYSFFSTCRTENKRSFFLSHSAAARGSKTRATLSAKAPIWVKNYLTFPALPIFRGGFLKKIKMSWAFGENAHCISLLAFAKNQNRKEKELPLISYMKKEASVVPNHSC